MIVAIDPGTVESAYVVVDHSLRPVAFEIVDNLTLVDWLREDLKFATKHLVIEMIDSYGLEVGKEVFETCVWIGRFWEAAREDLHKDLIYRREEKMNLCGTMRAKDANISQALRDRFGVKGTKKNPGWFYGFRADIWQAYAVAVTYYDLKIMGG